MHRSNLMPLSSKRAFTLIELLVVIAIIAMLGVLALPQFNSLIERSRSAACMGNLKALGAAVGSYAADNDSKLPYINNPARPVYTDEEDLPDDVQPQTLLEAFAAYDVTERTLRCPADVLAGNRFAAEGSSYEWIPRIDGESNITPKIYTRRGAFNLRSASRVRLVIDIEAVHFGRQNRLYADGRVQAFSN